METNQKKQSMVWGGLLILFGVIALLDTFIDFSGWIWVVILGVIGLGIFMVYLSDRSNEVLLIPVYILWAVALFVGLILLDFLPDAFVATFVLTAVAIPFIVAYLRDRSRWGFLIPAYVLLAVGFMVPLLESGVLSDTLVPTYVMFVIAIPFFAVFLRNHAHWWALIPGGILTIIGFAFLVAETAVEYIVPVVLILAGLGVLLSQFLPGKSTKEGITAEKK